MPFVPKNPVRCANPETIILAGRFKLNGAFSSAVYLPESSILAGRGFRVLHAGVGVYQIYVGEEATPHPRKDPNLTRFMLSANFVIRSPQGTLYAPCGGVSLGASSLQTGAELEIRNSSFNRTDLSTSDVLSFIAIFQEVRAGGIK